MMKRIDRRLLQGTNWALAGLLTMLAGCKTTKTNDPPPCVYGPPPGFYERMRIDQMPPDSVRIETPPAETDEQQKDDK